ncbi:MAG: GTPase Era [Candidatus Dadabacteria bacterium RIFCSPHIGHO2_12_FULL_53_21]|jgi:GTP-binding protein Era|nr:MAG: GTPase Era [Candidatus Dadabacteria bacterium RIFCSPHIGHO2_12_FULL_53_21]
MANEIKFRSGFISVIGRPNVGKSTLINAVTGMKIAAVSDKPNTTRNRILGIKTLPGAQLVFIDTPGIHKARGKLGKAMVHTAMSAIHEADVIMMMIEVKDPFGKGDRFIIENLPKPAILVINKIDTVKKGDILGIIDESRRFEGKFLEVIPISARNADGIGDLLDTVVKYMPEGPRYFPEDMVTDQPERFLAAEFIREKIFQLTREEIPYKTAVVIEEFKDVPEKELVRISALIYVERVNHKGIIIGKKGEMLKTIGSQAREDIERVLGTKVFLELWVKVSERWTDRENLIKDYGYGT